MEIENNHQQQTATAKANVKKHFEEMKKYLDEFIKRVDQVKRENNGVLPDEYVQAVNTAREQLNRLKSLSGRTQ